MYLNLYQQTHIYNIPMVRLQERVKDVRQRPQVEYTQGSVSGSKLSLCGETQKSLYTLPVVVVHRSWDV